MKALVLLMSIVAFTFNVNAQSDDIPIDESLIIRLANTASGGYLSKLDLKRARTLEVNERGSLIVSFDYICEKDGFKTNIHNEGAELNDQIFSHLNSLKIGTKVSFENIRVENASGEVLAKPLLLTVKS